MKLILALVIIGAVHAVPRDAEVCTPQGSVMPAPDCRDMPRDNITKPLYPSQFTVQAPGYINFPLKINGTNLIKLNTTELTHYLDSSANTLKFDGKFDLFGPFKVAYNYTHKGNIIYNQVAVPWVCVCVNLGVGIFKYDAFLDAEYRGRETIELEFGMGKVLTDHYVKAPGHNLWMGVESGLPVRFFQEGMGLQVYSGWKIGPPGSAIMDPPTGCVDVGGCRSADGERESEPAQEHVNLQFVSPLDYLADRLRSQFAPR